MASQVQWEVLHSEQCKVLFEYFFFSIVVQVENPKVRNDTERYSIICVALTVAIVCLSTSFTN